MLSDPLFVTYAARAGGTSIGLPGVSGPDGEVVFPLSPQLEHPGTRDAEARYNRQAVVKRTRPFLIVSLVGIAASSFSITQDARANGRFPEAQAIETIPGGDKNIVYLRATFGVLLSKDGGKTWRWICERALGYDGQWDPPITLTHDGRLWVGLETGLASTRDGCELELTPELEGQTVKDLTTDLKGETLWAITGAPGKRSFVWRRLQGKKFERLAGMDDTNFMTIEVAPSSASRVYVSGQSYSTIRGQIFRSDDGGATLKTDIGDGGLSSSGLTASGPFFIGAIDKDDPNRLLVRHLHAQGSDLLLSKDGGKTFKNVLSMKSAMFGFAKSPDGSTYWAGSGLAEHGMFASTDRGETFSLVANRGVLCMHSAATDSLFVCDNSLTLGGPVVSVSRDQGKTSSPLARFSDIEGPIACSAPDAHGSFCASLWPAVHQTLLPYLDAGSDARAPDAEVDAGSEGPGPSAKGSSCKCEAALGASPRAPFGAPSNADLRLLIVGLVALFVRVRSCIMRGSKLTHQR